MKHLKSIKIINESQKKDFWEINPVEYRDTYLNRLSMLDEEWREIKDAGIKIDNDWYSDWRYVAFGPDDKPSYAMPILITKVPDDWYIIAIENRKMIPNLPDRWNRNKWKNDSPHYLILYFKCDEITGLVNCIKWLTTNYRTILSN